MAARQLLVQVSFIIRPRSPHSSFLNQIPPSPLYQEPHDQEHDPAPVPASDSLLEYFLSNFLRKNSSYPENQGRNSEQLDNRFNGVSHLLKSSGYYTVMSAFLDTQLYNGSKKKQRKLTIFAPLDRDMIMDVREFSSVFRAHTVPKRLPWKDLNAMINNGTELLMFSGDGHKIRVGDDVLKFNGIRVVFLDMYDSGSLVVHGIRARSRDSYR